MYDVSLAAINFAGEGERSETVQVTTSSLECEAGEFLQTPTLCSVCPEGGICDSTPKVYALPNYWQSLQNLGDPFRIHACIQAENCLGTRRCINGNTTCNQCALGYSGPICARCTTGWALSTAGRCVDCSGHADGSQAWIIMASAVVLLLALVVFGCSCAFAVDEEAETNNETSTGSANNNNEDDDDDDEEEISPDEEVTPDEAMSAIVESVGLQCEDTSQIGNSDILVDQARNKGQQLIESASQAGPRCCTQGVNLPRLTSVTLSKCGGLIKITLSFLQIVITFDELFPDVPWPVSLSDFWYFWSVFANFQFIGSLSLDCATSDFSYYHSFVITIISPVVCLVLIGGVTFVRLRLVLTEKEETGVKAQGVDP